MKHDLETIRPDLYVVRNQEGYYFHARGLKGYGGTWQEDINAARFYTKLGSARSRVTWFTRNYPQYGVPEILKLKIVGAEVLNEKERVKKAIKKIKEDELKYEMKSKERRKKELEEDIAEMQKELNDL